MARKAHSGLRSRWAIIISLAVFSCAVAVGLSPARGQGNPGAKRRAPAPPSPEETALRSRAIHEAIEQCAALVEAGDHRKAVPMLADLRRTEARWPATRSRVSRLTGCSRTRMMKRSRAIHYGSSGDGVPVT